MRMEWVPGVKVELKKEKIVFFVLKIYEDQLGSKSEQQPFLGNSARKLVGYFNDANKSASVRIPS